LGGWDQEDPGLRPAQAEVLLAISSWEVQDSMEKNWDPISKITRGQKNGGWIPVVFKNEIKVNILIEQE
jgi:hypothetical protein